MNNVVSNTMLNYNTHLMTERRFGCSRSRPCYLRQSCKYCFSRWRKYLVNQLESIVHDWTLYQMTTITVEMPIAHPACMLSELIKMRPKLHRTIKKFGCYISVTSVFGKDGITAHYHIMMPKTEKDNIKSAVSEWMIYKPDVNVEIVYQSQMGHFKRTLVYLIRNYHQSLVVKPKAKQLLTASKGFYTGRPRNLEKFAWLI